MLSFNSLQTSFRKKVLIKLSWCHRLPESRWTRRFSTGFANAYSFATHCTYCHDLLFQKKKSFVKSTSFMWFR